LCKLMNVLCPELQLVIRKSRIHVKQKENIELFLKACTDHYGMIEEDLFKVDDLFCASDLHKVILALDLLQKKHQIKSQVFKCDQFIQWLEGNKAQIGIMAEDLEFSALFHDYATQFKDLVEFNNKKYSFFNTEFLNFFGNFLKLLYFVVFDLTYWV